MLPLGLFRSRAFTGVQLAAFAVSSSIFALFLYITLYLQNYLGLTPLRGRPALPADHGGELLRRAGGRPAAVARAGAPDAVVGLTARRRRPAADGRASRPAPSWTTLLGGFVIAGAAVGPAQPRDRRRRRQRRARRSRAAWRPASTTPSGRSGSRSASPCGARSSSGSGADKVAELTRAPPPRAATTRASSSRPPRPATSTRPSRRSRRRRSDAVAHAAREGFLTGLQRRAAARRAWSAFAGAVAALWLVRERRDRAGPGRGAHGGGLTGGAFARQVAPRQCTSRWRIRCSAAVTGR